MIFAEFWLAYPAASKHKGSKAKAERLWNQLGMYDRHAVMQSLTVYQDHLAETEWLNPKMAATYLGRDRHWEDFQPVVQAQIEKTDQLREQVRERNRQNQEYADQQWADRYEKMHGHRPEGS